MNVSNAVASSTRVFRLWITMMFVAMAVAMIPTKSEAGTLQLSPTGDGREIVVKALRGIRNVKSFRIRWEYSIAGRVSNTFLMSVNSGLSHTLERDGETFSIGEAFYKRNGNSPLERVSLSHLNPPPVPSLEEELKRIAEIRFVGTETLDGAPVLAYEYRAYSSSGKIGNLQKIWIRTKDGLVHRTEFEDQGPAESVGITTDSGLVTVKLVKTYYDYNADMTIELPERAAREAAESWLKLVDSEKYPRSWAQAADILKARYTEETWVKRLQGFVLQAHGVENLKSKDLISVQRVKSLPSSPYREGVVLSYSASFSKAGLPVQTLEVVLDGDNVWRVANYTSVVPGQTAGVGPGSGYNMGGVPGRAAGVGPESGYNMGGGMGPGGKPSAGANSRGQDGAAAPVDTKPVPLNSPQPSYTEEARNNKIEGNVTLRVLIGVDGLVKQVRVLRGLPDGLDEQAIMAAYKLRFKPAMKGGVPVAYWMPVIVEFNLGRK